MLCLTGSGCALPPDTGQPELVVCPFAQAAHQKGGEHLLKRAMTEEAKTARAREILDTAERLFLESG